MSGLNQLWALYADYHLAERAMLTDAGVTRV